MTPALLGLLLTGALSAANASAMGSNAGSDAAGPSLIFVVDQGTEMPMARIERDRVIDGMSLELGRLLAQRMGRNPLMVAVPRKRLVDALRLGQADLACAYLPAWLPGDWVWSKPFFIQEYAIVSRADVPRPARLEALRSQRIGTVLGFVYPELEAALGLDFVREDAPDAAANLRKLAADRLQHIAVSQRLLGYQRRQGQFDAAVHPPLPVGELRTQCALSPRSRLELEALNRAIDAIERDGSLAALYRRYDYAADTSTRKSSRP